MNVVPSFRIDTTITHFGKRDIWWDVDGTLANNSHRRHHLDKKPKDWKAFYETMDQDVPFEDMKWLCNHFYDQGHRNIVCTGRLSKHRDQTVDWLFEHDIRTDAIYTRADGDFRDDSVVKLDLLQQMISDGYYPTLAFDDRDRVVTALRSVGMRVLQVEDGKF